MWLLEVKQHQPTAQWLNCLNIILAKNNEVIKLLGTTFGFSFTWKDANGFLLDRIQKSLGWWSSTKINSTRGRPIVNGIFLSTTYFFTSIWVGTKKWVIKVKSAVTNYFWSRSLNRSRSKVSWIQCCQTKNKGEVNLINPVDAMTTLMVKWVIKAMELGTSNLHHLLRH
jgi:hypothetical protein